MILNLTQHAATAEQRAGGVVDLQGERLDALKDALTFDELPSAKEIRQRAEYIAELASHNGLGEGGEAAHITRAMIGGAPFFMSTLELALDAVGIEPLYAFSRREVVEEADTDGSVRKVAIFRHLGFVSARED